MSDEGDSSLYSSGDIILQNPIESSAIFLVVVVLCASIEYLFALADEIHSKFFRLIFDTVAEEVLVVGVLSLLLTFGSSFVGDLPTQWRVMLQWTHICLLFMGIAFVFIVVVVTAVSLSLNAKWKKFEVSRMTGTVETLSHRQLKFRQAWEKFCVSMRAHGYPTSDVAFADYLLRAEKANLVALGDLKWKSWLALSIIVVLNALRTRLNPRHPSETDPSVLLNDTDSLINVAAFVALVGYGTMAGFLVIHFSLQRRFRQYLMLGANPTGGGETEAAEPLVQSKQDLDDPQAFLLWQNTRSTMSLIQAVLMFLVWYVAVFFLNMMHATFSFNVGMMLLLIVAALVPVAVFLILVPWTLTTVAVLSTIGSSLNTEWVDGLIEVGDIRRGKKAKAAGGGGGGGGVGGMAAQEENKMKARVVERPKRPIVVDEHSLIRLASPGARGEHLQHHSI